MNANPLPEDGLDLHRELYAQQARLFDLALERTGGNRGAAARLLRTDVVGLERLRRILARAAGPDMKQPDETAPDDDDAKRDAPTVTNLQRPDPSKPLPSKALPASDLPRIKNGVQQISRAVIVRLDAEGYTPRQIATRLGCSPFFVEKVLRMIAAPLAKCGTKPSERPAAERHEGRRVTSQPCPDHDTGHVCERCPEQYDTDGAGFVHSSRARGRVALRHCRHCGKLTARADWSARDWFSCSACALQSDGNRCNTDSNVVAPLQRVTEQHGPDGSNVPSKAVPSCVAERASDNRASKRAPRQRSARDRS